MGDNQNLYEVAITQIPGIGPQMTRQLVSYCGSPFAVFNAPPGKLQIAASGGRARLTRSARPSRQMTTLTARNGLAG